MQQQGQTAKLTKRVVDTVIPVEREFFVWDEDLSGFGLRVLPSGRKVFIAQFRVGHGRGARQRRVSLGTHGDLTVDQARKKAKELISASRLGEDRSMEIRTSIDEAMTVQKLCQQWAEEAAHMDRRTGRARKPVRIAEDMARLQAHIFPLVGSLRLQEVRRRDIEKARDAISSGHTARRAKTKPRGVQRITGGAGTAARTMRVLSSVFAFAVDREYIKENPVKGVKLKPDEKKERFLSGDELARIGAALNAIERSQSASPNGPNVIRLMALTGARRGEIEALKWSDVDLERRLVSLSDSKTGAKVFPLAPAAAELIESLVKNKESDWVFPAARGDGHYCGTGKFWRGVRTQADLEDVRLHDLRHTFASFGASAGMGLPIIGALLGHRQAATTQRYAHLADDPVQHAAGRIGDEFAGYLDKGPNS